MELATATEISYRLIDTRAEESRQIEAASKKKKG